MLFGTMIDLRKCATKTSVDDEVARPRIASGRLLMTASCCALVIAAWLLI